MWAIGVKGRSGMWVTVRLRQVSSWVYQRYLDSWASLVFPFHAFLYKNNLGKRRNLWCWRLVRECDTIIDQSIKTKFHWEEDRILGNETGRVVLSCFPEITFWVLRGELPWEQSVIENEEENGLTVRPWAPFLLTHYTLLLRNLGNLCGNSVLCREVEEEKGKRL